MSIKPTLSTPVAMAIIFNKIGEITSTEHSSIFEALNGILHNFYHFTKSHFVSQMGHIDRKEYFYAFYAIIMNEQTELPDVFLKGIALYFGGTVRTDTSINETVLSVLREQIAAYRIKMSTLDSDTNEIRNILAHRPVISILELLQPLLRWFRANPEHQELIYADIFNYGYIEGIRAERRRRLKKGGVSI